jgi:uncharacterized protein YbjT (DUF2867 family)
VATVLATPDTHVGRTYHLTAERSRDMTAIAQELTDALGRNITYLDVPHAQWVRTRLTPLGLPEYIREHLSTVTPPPPEGGGFSLCRLGFATGQPGP